MTFKERAKELVSKMTYAEKMSQLKYDAPAIERLGIPAYNWWNEALHGVARSGCATVFPQAISMAASFNDELLKEVGTAVSDEARAKYNEYKKFGETKIYQGLTLWSPNINIFRDPRWGRGHETYGEDPYLTGRMGTAYVKGLQGDEDGVSKYRKADACLKHFAVHSGPESIRHGFDSKVNEKDFYETYLAAFKYCIENAHPSSVMGAYNSVNGEICCGSKKLIKDVLYGELGFDGYYLSDCGAICDINRFHKKTKNEAESAALAVNSGCNLNCGSAYQWLKTAAALNLIDEEVVTEACEKLFEARFRLGMFDEDCEYDNIPYDIIECDKHRELNLKMAEETVVLLKNNGILPIKETKGKTIAVIGPNADEKSILLGNYNGTPSRYSTILRGIQDGCDARIIYAAGCHVFEENPEHKGMNNEEAIIAAKMADIVIMVMGLNPTLEGEEGDAYNADLGGDKADLELPKSQRTLINKIAALKKPTVFVNVSGSAIGLGFEDENFDAVLQCFYPGAEGGNALANIIFGKTSPSGRLPVTFYRSADDLPDFTDYSMDGRTYKFFKGTPVYPFGHGLNYSEIKENWLDENTVELQNKGEYNTAYSVLKFEYIPHKNLCGFKKVFIKKGETLTVKF